MITIHTKKEYKNLIENIQKIIQNLDLTELKNFTGTDKIDIEHRHISSMSNKDFPKAINFKFQIADETFLSWEETSHLENKIKKIHKSLKELLEI